MKNEIISAADVVASAAINGVAQGIVIVLLISLGLKLVGKTNAATRHAIWFSVLLLLGVLPVAHALRNCLMPHTRDAAQPAFEGAEQLSFLATPDEADPAELLQDSLAGADGSYTDESLNDGAAQQAPVLSASGPLDLLQKHTLAEAGLTAAPPTADGLTSASAAAPPSAIEAFLKPIGSRLWKLASPSVAIGMPSVPYIGAGLVLLWAAISAVKMVQLLCHLRAIRRLKHEAKTPPGWLGCFFRQLYERSGVARPVELKVSESVQSPVLLGFRQPLILFPLQIAADSVEPVLRHELAHVARRDDWTNLAQQTVCALFFFHPGVWWVSRKLSLEREIACDDHVLQEGSRPGHYARLLMDLAGRLQGSRLALLAPGVSTNKSQLKQRIDMILDTKRNRSARLGKIRLGLMTCLGTLAAAMAVYGGPRIIFAHDETAAADAAVITADNVEENVVSVVGISEDVSEGEPDAPDAPPAPAGVEPGPKLKVFSDGPSIRMDAPRAVLIAPAPPAPMIAAAAPPAPGEPARPRPGRVHFADGSLEERLDRLERMVESLMAQQGVKPKFEFHWKDSTDHDFKIDRKEIEKSQEMARHQVEDARKQIKELDIDNIKENARKEAMRASEDARRAGREAQRAVIDQQRQNRDMLKEGSEMQLEALRKHHEMLKREMEKLDRQIQEIQQHRDHWGENNREIDQNQNQNRNEDLRENPASEPAKR